MRMSYLYNIISIKSPPSLYEVIPALQRSHCYTVCFKPLPCRAELFQNLFVPFAVNELNKLDSGIKNNNFYAIF